MNWKYRITVDPDVLAGKFIIKGTRISVELIFDRVADGWTTEDILSAYPHLSRDDVLVALSFAAEYFGRKKTIAAGKVAV
ncbi:DUF433 domain-containing protein [Methylomicrobium sp. Wu6]|uniref:DUF433 domain-containing protein n=1 Tax=Methylomicrobium sp. Wu6 TaxID=3107928 RepID=UPI002DD65754|nr:DUF433 domain-containing protein [Methylomicrobium sp. Wu6]MEC4747659.1 DUF433 domain-containing protein [Methylomicrobium sp. Wu6]